MEEIPIINDREQLKKEVRNLSEIINMYHQEAQRKQTQFGRTIKKFQL
jgi:uncharacterized protein YlxW (UPF0749 family)